MVYQPYTGDPSQYGLNPGWSFFSDNGLSTFGDPTPTPTAPTPTTTTALGAFDAPSFQGTTIGGGGVPTPTTSLTGVNPNTAASTPTVSTDLSFNPEAIAEAYANYQNMVPAAAEEAALAMNIDPTLSQKVGQVVDWGLTAAINPLALAPKAAWHAYQYFANQEPNLPVNINENPITYFSIDPDFYGGAPAGAPDPNDTQAGYGVEDMGNVGDDIGTDPDDSQEGYGVEDMGNVGDDSPDDGPDDSGAASAGDTGEGGGEYEGGLITAEKLRGTKNPRGPDDGYRALDIGEFVMSAKATKHLGPEFMGALNELGKLGASKEKLRGALAGLLRQA